MKLKIILGVLIAVCVALTSYIVIVKRRAQVPTNTYNLLSREEEASEPEPHDHENSVHFTEQGFTPLELTISLNTEVEFENLGKEPHWPASDPHPTHTIYPEFDPEKQIEPGEVWKFTFDKPGVWKYHDHYNPEHRGTIIVTDADGKLPEQILNAKSSATNLTKADDTCLKNQSTDFTCYETYYQALVRTKGTKTAFDDFKERYKTNNYIVSQCHPIAHIIGRATAEKFEKVSEAYKLGDNFCWSGYYHGVMEEIVGRVGRTNVTSQLNSICSDIPGNEGYSFDYFNCVHGLGHGLMAISENDLPKSLNLCDSLEGGWEESSCYGGVFMENVMADHRAHHTDFLDPNRPLFPCDSIDSKYQNQCYLMQTSYMMKLTNNNFGKIFELCEGAGNFKPTCWQSLGRDASGSTSSNASRTKDICMMGKSYDQQLNCVIGAVKDFVSYFHGESEAKIFCNMLEVKLSQACLSTEQDYFKAF